MPQNRKRLIVIYTAIYVVLITLLSLIRISAPGISAEIFGFDKVVHFCFYFGLNILLVSTIIARRGSAKATQIVATTLVSIVYGVTIEFIQKEVGRSFEVYDIVANSVGAITAATILLNSKIRGFIKSHIQ